MLKNPCMRCGNGPTFAHELTTVGGTQVHGTSMAGNLLELGSLDKLLKLDTMLVPHEHPGTSAAVVLAENLR